MRAHHNKALTRISALFANQGIHIANHL